MTLTIIFSAWSKWSRKNDISGMYRGFEEIRQRYNYRKWENGYSAAIIIFALSHQTYGGYKAVCKMEYSKD